MHSAINLSVRAYSRCRGRAGIELVVHGMVILPFDPLAVAQSEDEAGGACWPLPGSPSLHAFLSWLMLILVFRDMYFFVQ